jgi:NTP pyrophosphatase (non-canonical NTP hydrolase)
MFKKMNKFFALCHQRSYDAGWWHSTSGSPYLQKVGGNIVEYNEHIVPTKLMLIASEIAEAMEAHRKSAMDEKLPNRTGIECELADAVIRIGDLAAALDLDLAGAIKEKMAFNLVRPDHKILNRRKAGGKRY